MGEIEPASPQIAEAGTNTPEAKKEWPVKSLDRYVAGLYFALGLATRESAAHFGENPDALKSPHTRLQRGLEYHRLKTGRRLERLVDRFNGILSKIKVNEVSYQVRPPDKEFFRQLDRFDNQYQAIRSLEVDTPETGAQPLTYSDVFLGDNPSSCDEVAFFIPAFSGTRYGYERLSRVLAEKGSRVISFDYPDSHLGKPQELFTQKVKESNNPHEPVDYNPHTTLFKEAIHQMVGQINSDGKERKVTVYAYSTGCPILAEALNDPEFSKIVNIAVLLSPASAVDQSPVSLGWGFRSELLAILRREGSKAGRFLGRLENLVNTGVVIGSQTRDDEEVMQRRGEISGVLINKVCRKSDAFKTARVAEGGTIVVQTGTKDKATKSDGIVPEWLAKNDQMISLSCESWSHVSPVYFADRLVLQIDKIIKNHPTDRRQTFTIN